MNSKLVCVGGPFHGDKVSNKGSWFKVGDNEELEYFNSTIYNGEFKGKYIQASVYLTQDSSNYITLYLWESNGEHLKAHLYGK